MNSSQNLEIDIQTADIVRNTILKDKKIDSILHIILVISNPCNYKRRIQLAKDFINRIKKESNVKLYIVELTFGNQEYQLTESTNPKHLQLNTNTDPLWHKENLINLGIQNLLPDNWKAVAWIDADIEFDNPHWVSDTLKLLNKYDVVQLFNIALDLDQHQDPQFVHFGFCYQYFQIKERTTNFNININNNQTLELLCRHHTGFAWAITKDAYEAMNGLYEFSIIGSGDFNFCLALINKAIYSLNNNSPQHYKDSIIEYQLNIKRNITFAYTPGIIKHFYHGEKINRKYHNRWTILAKNKYDPFKFITKDNFGLLIPTKKCPKQLLIDIKNYFIERNEDEYL